MIKISFKSCTLLSCFKLQRLISSYHYVINIICCPAYRIRCNHSPITCSSGSLFHSTLKMKVLAILARYKINYRCAPPQRAMLEQVYPTYPCTLYQVVSDRTPLPKHKTRQLTIQTSHCNSLGCGSRHGYHNIFQLSATPQAWAVCTTALHTQNFVTEPIKSLTSM